MEKTHPLGLKKPSEKTVPHKRNTKIDVGQYMKLGLTWDSR